MMNYKNAIRNLVGGIDCEIDHPDFGWIPFTANLGDSEPIGKIVYDTIVDTAGGLDNIPSEVAPDPAVIAAEELAAWRANVAVTRFQAKAAMLQAGLLSQVEALISEADPLTQLAWQEAGFDRSSDLVASLGAQLGLSETEVDDLFIVAQGLSI